MNNLRLLQAFGQIVVPKDITDPDQEFLIENILQNEHFLEYPPSHSHQRAFWKWIIQNIEATGEEVDERIYERYIQLLPSSVESHQVYVPSAPPSASYTTYLIELPIESSSLLSSAKETWLGQWNNLFSITLMESRKTIEQGTTGFRTWQPSLILGDWLLRHPMVVRDRALELGCGVGLLGVIIASLQRAYEQDQDSYLEMTDVIEGVLNKCRSNVKLPSNGLGAHKRLGWSLLDWRDALPGAEGRQTLIDRLRIINPTVVFGADLVYDVSIVPALVHLLSLLLSCLQRSPTIILAVTMRRQETFDTFLESLRNVGLDPVVSDLPPLKETVFAIQQSDVDKEATIKLVRVFKAGDNRDEVNLESRSTN